MFSRELTNAIQQLNSENKRWRYDSRNVRKECLVFYKKGYPWPIELSREQSQNIKGIYQLKAFLENRFLVAEDNDYERIKAYATVFLSWRFCGFKNHDYLFSRDNGKITVEISLSEAMYCASSNALYDLLMEKSEEMRSTKNVGIDLGLKKDSGSVITKSIIAVEWNNPSSKRGAEVDDDSPKETKNDLMASIRKFCR